MLTLDKIYHAAFVLKDVARKTDLIEAPKLSKDCQLYLKTENLQATGSFKVRGAYYKISQLSEEESAKGVIACSAGNHAQGVALAATRRGIKSIVCMPDGAPIMKVENTICVLVRPNCWSSLMKWSSSMVERKATSMSME